MDDSRLFLPDKLTGPEKYRQWANLAKLCLENAEVLEYVESDVEEPSSGADKKKAWRKNRAKAVLMLAKMIGGAVETFVEANDLIAGGCPFTLWKEIQARFHSTLSYCTVLYGIWYYAVSCY